MKLQHASVVLVAFWAACNSVKKDASVSRDAGASAVVAAAPAPLDAHELPTTSGALELDNLTAEINGYRSANAKAPSLDRLVSLQADLLLRGQYLGRLADYEEAEHVADAAVAQYGKDGPAYAARGRARAVYHRFAEALSDFDHAQ